jgi:uncharacterized SAM-dependent methyltransferase
MSAKAPLFTAEKELQDAVSVNERFYQRIWGQQVHHVSVFSSSRGEVQVWLRSERDLQPIGHNECVHPSLSALIVESADHDQSPGF